MSELDLTAGIPVTEPPPKRRRVHDDSLDSTPQYGSPDARPSSPPNTGHLPDQGLSIRRGPPSSRSPSRSRDGSPVMGNDASRRRYRSSHSQSRSQSARSRSQSRLRSRSRSASYSRSRSISRSRSHSRSRSRSRSRSLSSPSHPQPTTQDTPDHHHNHHHDRPDQPPIQPNYHPHLLLQGHTRAVSQVRISPDGRWIASASADGSAKLWDASTGAHLETLVGHMAGVSCLAWAPDSNTLATGSDDKAIRLWDRVTGSPAHAVAHRENTSAEGLGGGGGGGGGGVVMKGMAAKVAARRARMGVSGEGVRGGRTGRGPLLGHHNYVYCLAFSPKGNILASGSYDEAVFLWDVRAGRLMRSLPAHSDPVSGIDFCRDGTLVVSCSTDGLIRVWDTSTGQCLRTLVHEDNPAVTNVCFSPNGRFVLAFNLDNSIRLWDYVSGSVKKTYQGHTNKGFSIGGCFGVLTDHDDGAGEENADEDGARQQAFIASASEDGDIVLWDVRSKGVIQRIKGAHKGVCFWVDVHGGTMVSAGQDGVIKVFRHRPRGGHVKRENGDVNGFDGVNGHLEEEEAPDAAEADEELQRQVEAEAGSPGQHVKEEQL
ncbi:WD40-repeat-containing domain protein [Parachaetomium inaequale]|uniref:Mitochondrial division protein 1 n=1 Tax=Parachaetomium inaequale TaxID=2588326 RepID=A0AAN6STD5_9PEZI|nr:WD40-repeat-containing domain protein [Parachaetomium inaequale]